MANPHVRNTPLRVLMLALLNVGVIVYLSSANVPVSRSTVKQRLQMLSSICTAMDAYYSDCGFYPGADSLPGRQTQFDNPELLVRELLFTAVARNKLAVNRPYMRLDPSRFGLINAFELKESLKESRTDRRDDCETIDPELMKTLKAGTDAEMGEAFNQLAQQGKLLAFCCLRNHALHFRVNPIGDFQSQGETHKSVRLTLWFNGPDGINDNGHPDSDDEVRSWDAILPSS